MEKIGIQTLAGKVKLVGTTVGIGGAMVVTFYAGPEINIWLTTVDLSRGIQRGSASTLASHADESRNRILGTLLSLGSSISYALWLIIQTKLSERYPSYFSSTALMCIMGSIQSVIYALSIDVKWEEWKLGWNIRLWTVAYTGIVASGLMFTMIAWGLRVKEPLFVSAFNPLTLVFVAIMGSLLLEEKLVVGSVLIILGLYVLLWGKRKEMKSMSPLMPLLNSEEAEKHLEVVTETSTNNNPEINFHNLATGASIVSEEDEEEVVEKKKTKDEKEMVNPKA